MFYFECKLNFTTFLRGASCASTPAIEITTLLKLLKIFGRQISRSERTKISDLMTFGTTFEILMKHRRDKLQHLANYVLPQKHTDGRYKLMIDLFS